MKTALCMVLVLILVALGGCKRSPEKHQDLPYPLWILDLVVIDATTNTAVTGCPEATFEVEQDHSQTTVHCAHNTNEVYSYGHLSGVMRVWFTVRCAGYTSSERLPITFDEQNAVQPPDREGPVQSILQTILLSRQGPG